MHSEADSGLAEVTIGRDDPVRGECCHKFVLSVRTNGRSNGARNHMPKAPRFPGIRLQAWAAPNQLVLRHVVTRIKLQR
jgi:hypothetical protein